MKRSSRFLLAAALLTAAFPVDAGESITIAVSPRQSIGPTNLTVRLHVEPNADNRAVEVIADSGEFYRSSMIQLDGESAARTVYIEFRGVPSGEYQISGALFDSLGHRRGLAQQSAFVLSRGAER
jgi:hypothetical protein